MQKWISLEIFARNSSAGFKMEELRRLGVWLLIGLIFTFIVSLIKKDDFEEFQQRLSLTQLFNLIFFLLIYGG